VRRRVLQATVASVVFAVLLLGVPLAVAGVLLVHEQAERSAQDRVDALARGIDRRLEFGPEITAEVLQPYVYSGREWTGHVLVVLPDGERLSAGVDPGAEPHTATATTPRGAVVRIQVPRDEVFEAGLRVVLLVLGGAAVAIAGGWALGLVQARRLTAPLVELATSAERLGSGQTRAAPAPSGIAEVDQVAREISTSAERMAERLAAEREFASDASHQLRTPLTAVSMRLEEISSTTKDPAVAEEARIALEQVERLVQVVDDLLGRARRTQPGNAVAVRLADVLRQQREEWQPQFRAAGRSLDVQVGEDVVAFATPGPLAQTIATLFENSLQHGAGTTHVRTRLTGSSVVLEVGDQGAGVPETLGARVFERQVGGGGSTGLGLALARDLVAADGGRLELLRHRPPVFAVFLRAA
jgi:signal transduction histidine kinase